MPRHGLVIEPYRNYTIISDSSTRGGREFWATMGPVFVDRGIRKELEGPINCDDSHEWLIALHGDAVVGFSSFTTRDMERRGEVWLDATYVFPFYRKQGIYTRLFRLRLASIYRLPGVRTVRGLAARPAFEMFDAHGFVLERSTTKDDRFRLYRLDLHEGDTRDGSLYVLDT